MKRSITVKRKKRGRPATGTDPLIGVRLPADTIAGLDSWARKKGYGTRSDAVRAIIEAALKK